MKLISCTERVFELRKDVNKDNITRFWSIESYANFLQQPLTLSMFVPCNENGKVLEYYNYNSGFCQWTGLPLNEELYEKEQEFKQAKEKVIFEGFEITFNNCKEFKYQSESVVIKINSIVYIEYNFYHKTFILYNDNLNNCYLDTVEDLIPYNLTITQNGVETYKRNS